MLNKKDPFLNKFEEFPIIALRKSRKIDFKSNYCGSRRKS